MKPNELVERLTPEDIVRILEDLGSDVSNRSNNKELIFRSLCHESESYKLYYFIDSRKFYCYSHCHSIGKRSDIIDLIMHIKKCSLKDAVNEIKAILNIGNEPMLRRGFRVKRIYQETDVNDIDIELLPTPSKPFIYRTFKQKPIPIWEKDGISYETLKKFSIYMDDERNRIVIPHFCWSSGNVVGIRSRQLNLYDIENFGKYLPLFQGDGNYAHQLGKNLYGLNLTIDNIKKHKKALVGESEKFLLQLESILPNQNIGVSICGSSMSLVQKKILIDLDVEEVVMCLDKEYGTQEELELYINKLTKMTKEFRSAGIKTTAILDDIDGELELKESPTDRGRNVFLKLINKRIKLGE